MVEVVAMIKLTIFHDAGGVKDGRDNNDGGDNEAEDSIDGKFFVSTGEAETRMLADQ